MRKLIFIIVLFFSTSVFATNQSLLTINVIKLYVEENSTKISYELKNGYTKLIKLADSRVYVEDLLGEDIMTFKAHKDLYLNPNETRIFDHNFFTSGLSSHKRLKIIKFEDLVFEFEVNKIVFEDNEIIDFEE